MNTTKRSFLTSLTALTLCFVMLVGTTFAWFTDEVTSSNNVIQTGTLDIGFEWSKDNSTYYDSQNTLAGPIFTSNTLWEPGHTQVRYLKVTNDGSLSFKYEMFINPTGEVSELAEVIDVSWDIVTGNEDFVAPTADNKAGSLEKVGTLDALINSDQAVAGGVLLPEDVTENGYYSGEIIICVSFHMQETAGNDYQNKSIGDSFGITLYATQFDYENDSFDNSYDEDAVFPSFSGNYRFEFDISNDIDENNKIIRTVTYSDPESDKSVTLLAGTSVKPGVEKMVLTVDDTARSGNIVVNNGQASRSLDVHLDGLAEENTIPASIGLGAVMPAGYKDGSISLFHVEDGTPVQMESVDDLAVHNQFDYVSESGELSVCMSSFSEVTAVVAVADPWDGTIDTTWYNTTDTIFTIDTEEKLAGLGAIVGGMAEGVAQDDFSGKTIILGADLDLGGLVGRSWYPIGYYFTDDKNGDGTVGDYYCSVYSFEGTFDGNGHTIHNIYQSTWSMRGDDPYYDLSKNQYYNDGMGLFGFVYDGTVRNLTINNFQSDGEYSTTGCIAAYSSGDSTFENIKITNSNPRAYNVPNGGVVGYAYGSESDPATINFSNITVDASNKISALWGSWDVGCGGILGRVNGDATINMINCEVGAIIDAYNDVCGNYQYYQYRYAGMLIGTVGPDGDPTTGPETVNFSNVNVYIGSWADYYYCEFIENSLGSYTEDYQFSRVDREDINIDPSTNLPYDSELLSPCRHQHKEGEDKMGLYLPFCQLYTGYGWGATAVKELSGVNIIHYFYTVKYMDGEGKNVLDLEYVTEGERSETKLWADAYNIKTTSVNKFENKQFVGWVNTLSKPVTTIAAGNYKDVLVYESWQNPYIIRFVDINGNVLYSEVWTSSTQGLAKDPPEPPVIEGYVGDWEHNWKEKLKNVTSDVTIRPEYILKEYADSGNHLYVDSTMSAKQLFQYLEQGKSVVMAVDLEGSGSELGINGGKDNLCVVDDGVHGRLNLNSYTLTCTFDHNANNTWHVFAIGDASDKVESTLTISKGVADDGVFVVNFPGIKSNGYLFDIQPNGKLVLEAGVTIEINYTKHKSGSNVGVYGFLLNGKLESFDNYNGIYVERNETNDGGKITITVGVTTTITKDGVQQN